MLTTTSVISSLYSAAHAFRKFAPNHLSLHLYYSHPLYYEAIPHQHSALARQDLSICDIGGDASAVIVVMGGVNLAANTGVMSL